MLACLAGLAGLQAPHAQARPLAEYEHTSWGIKDGVVSVARTHDAPNGMLKLTTSIGDLVFDGAKFHLFANGVPPPLTDHAGALGQRSPIGAVYYVDPVDGRLKRQWQGRTETVEDRAISGTRTPDFVFDLDGIGWFQNGQELYRLEGLRVDPIDASWGITRATYGNPMVDKAGTTWVATDEDPQGALYFLPRGARRFERFAQPVACFPGAFAPDGSLWCANDRGIAVITIDGGRPVGLRFVSSMFVSFIAFDSRGGFWAARMSGGLAHLSDWRVLLAPHGETALDLNTMTTREGLASDGIWSIRGDAAGNVWVSTGSGLERFRPTAFTPVRLPRIERGAAIEADPDGSLWVGNFDGYLMHVVDGRIQDVPAVRQIRSIRRDAEDRVWVAGKFGLWRKDPGRTLVRIPGPGDASVPQLRDIAQDDSGALWFTHNTLLMRLRDGQWEEPQVPDAPPPTMRYFLLSDAQRQLWFFGNRSVHVLKQGRLRQIDDPAYASFGRVLSAYARGPRVWVGGTGGVGVFIGNAFQALRLKTDVANLSITGIVETPRGDLWLHGLGRAYRIARRQVDEGLQGRPVAPEVFDYHDGLRAVTSSYEPRPTLIQDANGRLWFSTVQGLFWVDERVERAAGAPPPQAVLGAVTSDGQVFPAGTSVSLRPNPGQVEIAYAAAALGISDRVHFRYRIIGIDDDWQDVGPRRTAYYTHLPPGRHQFKVQASNETGQWAETAATLDFEVRPAWYETGWFQVGIVMLGAGLFWLAYRMRVRVLESRERGRVLAIAGERERIARDLHDTLLQSMQGVVLEFHDLVPDLPVQNGLRQSIEGRLDFADQMLAEARDRIFNLRTPEAAGIDVRAALEQVAVELSHTHRIDIVEEGFPQALTAAASDGIYLVGREALLNAVKHGGGRVIELRLQYKRRGVLLRVRDDGIGIDAAVLAARERPGHFGLVGMQERAEQLRAGFRLSPGPEGGTDVVLDIPASHAYVTPRRAFWRRPRETSA